LIYNDIEGVTTMAHARIAESADVRFRPLEISGSGHTELKVSGLIFHSAVVANAIRVVDEGSATRVLVEMAVARPEKSGSFAINIPLPRRLEKVTFGLAGTEIWSRQQHLISGT
jgi:hypothetical protein